MMTRSRLQSGGIPSIALQRGLIVVFRFELLRISRSVSLGLGQFFPHFDVVSRIELPRSAVDFPD